MIRVYSWVMLCGHMSWTLRDKHDDELDQVVGQTAGQTLEIQTSSADELGTTGGNCCLLGLTSPSHLLVLFLLHPGGDCGYGISMDHVQDPSCGCISSELWKGGCWCHWDSNWRTCWWKEAIELRKEAF